MSRVYSSTNRIKFTDIPEKYAIPRGFKAKQQQVHSAVIVYVYNHYKDTKKFRQKVVDALNCLTYCVLQNDPPPFRWSSVRPIDTMPEMDMDQVEQTIGDFFLVPEAIEWDIQPVENDLSELELPIESSKGPIEDIVPEIRKPEPKVQASTSIPVQNKPLKKAKQQPAKSNQTKLAVTPTPKEDLYIQAPAYPRFDISKVWMSASVGGDNLVIYTTLPEIPTRQNEVSITTNVASMTESELMALYPNQLIHTRQPRLYDKFEGIDYDEDLGSIYPIEGFTKEQIVDNIIKYPHLFRLRKIGPDGQIMRFFTTIELNGDLYSIEDVWDEIPDSARIPRDSEFVKDYVIRRYLLEEENGIKHKYQMYGVLEPFLTLFMPCTDYIKRGYKDTLGIVKQCVISRIHYKQSRSPILKRIEQNGQLHI